MFLYKEESVGKIYAVFAFLFWGGISPIYFKEVSSVEPFEVLIYRVLFSFISLLPFLFFKKELSSFLKIIKDIKKLKYLFFSSIFASINWLIFIWAISNNKILEASLGYYINPLVNILLGFIFLNEKMSKRENIAILIAFMAVLYQFIILGYIPIVSISLAVSFGLYGLIRKKINLGSIVGLFIEILIVLPFAFLYIYYLFSNNSMTFIQNSNNYISFMLTLSGLITVIPLLLFNGAATRMRLSTLGFYQYLAPSIAFLLAIFVYNEAFNIDKLITFILIWVALFIISIDKIKIKFLQKIFKK